MQVLACIPTFWKPVSLVYPTKAQTPQAQFPMTITEQTEASVIHRVCVLSMTVSTCVCEWVKERKKERKWKETKEKEKRVPKKISNRESRQTFHCLRSSSGSTSHLNIHQLHSQRRFLFLFSQCLYKTWIPFCLLSLLDLSADCIVMDQECKLISVCWFWLCMCLLPLHSSPLIYTASLLTQGTVSNQLLA